jgi:low affinity Fe/Cu permease
MKRTDSRPVFVRRESCLLRISALDAQLDRLVAAKAEARAALVEIEHECGEEPTLTDNRLPGDRI